MHVHAKRKKKRKDGCMSMNERDGHKKKKKLFDNEVTLSHVGKSTTQSRWTKYLKNGTLREDYNASWRLKVWASHVPGAVYQ